MHLNYYLYLKSSGGQKEAYVMRIKKWRFFKCTLAAAMLFTAASCSDNNKAAETKTVFSVYVTSNDEKPTEDNKLLAKIEDELGYTFEFTYLNGNEAEMAGAMIADGSYPDILSCGDNTFVQAGALIPLDDYISEEKTPNIWKHIKDCYNKLCYEGDGHLYVIPAYGIFNGEETAAVYQGPAFWIQKAVLEEAGYPEVRTLDQYFELIEAYKEKHPTINGYPTIGFDMLAVSGFEWVLTTAPNYLDGNPNNGDFVVDNETYEAHIYANSDFSKRYYRKLSEEYAKGVIAPEAFAQNKEQYLGKIETGRVLGMFDQHWVFQLAEQELGEDGMYERQYVPLPLVFDEETEPWYRTEPYEQIGQGYGISINCEDPETAVQMFETFLSEEWQKVFQWGIEGEDYMVDENGRFYRTEKQRTEQSDPLWKSQNKLNAFFTNCPKIQSVYSDGNAADPGSQQEEFEASLNDYDKIFLARYGKKNWMEFMNAPRENPVYFPVWNIDKIDGSDADYARRQLNDLSIEFLPKLIMSAGNGFDAMWNEYCNEINSINIKAYEDRINEVIRWRVEHWTK